MAGPCHVSRPDAGREDALHRSMDWGNPACPESEKHVKQADALLCTHGHGDHIGDAVEVGKKLNPIAVGIYELCLWLQKKGVKQISPMNKGGTQTVAGVKITMVHAVHSCGIQDGDRSSTAAKLAATCWSFRTGLSSITQAIPAYSAIWRSFAISMLQDRHAAHRRPFHHVAT